MTSRRDSIYSNPSARHWKAPSSPNFSIEINNFYSNLPSFSPTPLVALPSIAKQLDIKAVYVKAETSRLGLPSFKLLGAAWAIRQAIIQHASLPPSATISDLTKAVKGNGIKLCAATDGNHGRAVARMGMLLGVDEIKIFVPKGLDEDITAKIKGEGDKVEVCVVEGDYDESVRVAHKWGEETNGGILIEGTAFEGYEDVPKWTVQGYTTMLYEIDEMLGGTPPNLVVVPCGVGSLSQAIVSHYKTGTGQTSVMTVEPHTAASLYQSLNAGKSLSIKTSKTIMTGLECGTISTAAWKVLKEGVDFSTTIGDWECHEAVCELSNWGVEAGPCGAASLAGFKAVVTGENGKGRENLGLDNESIVVLICTEGERKYEIPESAAKTGLEP